MTYVGFGYIYGLIAGFDLVDRRLSHRLPGSSSVGIGEVVYTGSDHLLGFIEFVT